MLMDTTPPCGVSAPVATNVAGRWLGRFDRLPPGAWVGIHDPLVDELRNDVQFIYLEDVRAGLGIKDKAAGALGPVAPWAFAAHPDPKSPAVILFTSGTEGDPKGVVLSHFNIVANVHQVLAHVPEALGPEDVLFNPLPTFHCFGLTAGALLPLLTGGRDLERDQRHRRS